MQDLKFPHDKAAEEMVLGTCLVIPDAFPKIATIITEKDMFYEPFYKTIFALMMQMTKNGQPIDLVSVAREYSAKYPNSTVNVALLLTDIAAKCMTSTVMYHANVLVELYQKRMLITEMYQILTKSQDASTSVSDIVSEACEKLRAILIDSHSSEILSIVEVMRTLSDTISRNLSSNGDMPLVNIMGHINLYSSRLVVLAADTSQGKTALMLSTILQASKMGTPCGYISLEMPGMSIGSRLLGIETSITPHAILHNALMQDEVYRADTVIGVLEKLPVYISDKTKHSLNATLATIRKMVWKHKVKMVAVDYAQILNIEDQKKGRTDEMLLAEIARTLQELATELDICVVLLSQFNRDTTSTTLGVPNINRLRGSAQIAEACDICLILYRPEALCNGKVNTYPEPYDSVDPKGTAMVSVVKDRHGDTDRQSFILGFDGPSMRFYDLHGNIPTRPTANNSKSSNRPF